MAWQLSGHQTACGGRWVSEEEEDGMARVRVAEPQKACGEQAHEVLVFLKLYFLLIDLQSERKG